MDNFDWSQFDKKCNLQSERKVCKEKIYRIEQSMEDVKNAVIDGDGVFYSKDGRRLLHAPHELESYSIPEGVEVICSNAFYFCKQLRYLKIPKSLECVGWSPFSHCESLKTLEIPSPSNLKWIQGSFFENYIFLRKFHIPSSVEHIEANPLWNCPNASISSNSPFFIVENNTLYDSNKTRIISYWGDKLIYDVPGGIEIIGNAAFNYNNSLRTLIIGNDVSVIKKNAFYYCKKIEHVYMSDKIVDIGGFTFCGCHNLQHTILSNSLTSLSTSLFSECSSLESIVIPDSVTQIQCDCFNNCNRLREMSLSKNIEYIGKQAFQSCSELKKIIFPKSLKEIDEKAFRYCNNLSEIWFMGDCPQIGDRAFKSCRIQTVHVGKDSGSNWKEHFPYAEIVCDL